MKTSLKSIQLPLLLVAHGLTQVGLSVPDQTWRGWLSDSSQDSSVALVTGTLFVIRFVADLGLFLWILGPERRELAWNALSRLRITARKRPAIRA